MKQKTYTYFFKTISLLVTVLYVLTEKIFNPEFAYKCRDTELFIIPQHAFQTGGKLSVIVIVTDKGNDISSSNPVRILCCLFVLWHIILHGSFHVQAVIGEEQHCYYFNHNFGGILVGSILLPRALIQK